MTDRPLRIGLWLAVSSQPQAAADKSSLDDQEQAGRRFAAGLGSPVIAVYRVDGFSRDVWNWYEAEATPGLEAYRHVREDLEAGRLDMLHCVAADRLGRDPALVQQFYSLAGRHGCEIYDASAPHVLGRFTAANRYVAAIQSVSAGEANSLRVYRQASGMRGRVLKRKVHPGKWPIGYRAVRDSLGQVVTAEFDEQIGVVDLATGLFLQGHSYGEIYRRVAASGYAPPEGPAWCYETVRHILNNDCYAGIVQWRDVRLEAPSDRFPARWDAETFAAIVRERQRRTQAPYMRSGGGPYTGVAYCRRCGYRMARESSRGRWYLRCSLHVRKALTGRTCHFNSTPEHRVTSAIRDWLAEFVTPERVDQALAELGAGGEGERIREDAARARAVIRNCDQQRERLALNLAGGYLDGAMYRTLDDRLLEQLRAETTRAAELDRMLANLPDLAERRALLEQMARMFDRLVDLGEPAEVARALQAAGIRAWCEEGRVTVAMI
ncbi:MAG: recombinase family protein [Alphaproteobacteria bacterium]